MAVADQTTDRGPCSNFDHCGNRATVILASPLVEEGIPTCEPCIAGSQLHDWAARTFGEQV